jgi:phage-related protein
VASLGEAFINVRADLKPFTKDLAKELKVILDSAEKVVQKRGKEIGRNLSDSMADGARANASKIGDVIGKEVKKRKIEIKTVIDKDNAVAQARGAFDGVERLAKSASTSISKRFADTFASAGRFISGTLDSAVSSIGGGGGGKGGPIGAAVVGGAITILISLIAALIPLALQAAQAVGALAGSLALIPVAGAAVAAVMGVLNLAFMGFDKAISAAVSGDLDAFNKALEDLTPSARKAARSLFEPLKKLQDLVQEAVFQQLVGPFKELSKLLSSPAFKQGIDLIARSLGSLIGEFIKMIATQEGLATINAVFDAIYQVIAAIQPVVRPLGAAIAAIIRAGAPALVTLAQVLATIVQHFADFIQKAKASGALDKFFDDLSNFFLALGPAVENIIGLLGQFVAWSLENPTAITAVADAILGLASALAQAFQDPQVIASLAAIIAVLGSIPPEAWGQIAIAVVRIAVALGIFGAALLYIVGILAVAAKAVQDFFLKLFGATDNAGKKLKEKAAVFRDAGKALISAFLDGMKQFAGKIGDVAGAIVGSIKSKINAAIGGINRGLANAFSVFGFNPPDIPFLAKGGIIDGPTLAVVGEKGPEAVVPLNNPSAAAAVLMRSGLANMMSTVVQVFLGTEELDQRVYRVVSANNTAQATSLRHGPRTT